MAINLPDYQKQDPGTTPSYVIISTADKQIYVIHILNYNEIFACVNEILNVEKIRLYFANTYLLKLFRRDSQFIIYVDFYVNPKL